MLLTYLTTVPEPVLEVEVVVGGAEDVVVEPVPVPEPVPSDTVTGILSMRHITAKLRRKELTAR